MIVDSNIIIYASQPQHSQLRKFILDHSPLVSAISYVEVLGYHQLTEFVRHYFEQFFQLTNVLPITQSILDQAVSLRQKKKVSLGDSLIAGTALIHKLTLVTNNTDDFKWINDLTLLNPFEMNSIDGKPYLSKESCGTKIKKNAGISLC